MTELELRVDGTIVRLRGDLDAQSAPVLDDALATLARTGATRVVLDLAGVGFVDSSGLRSMVLARGPDGAREVVLRAPTTAALRILEITGLTDGFRIEP